MNACRQRFGKTSIKLAALIGVGLGSLACTNVGPADDGTAGSPNDEVVGRTQEGLVIGANIFYDGFDGGSLNRGNWNVQSSVVNDACSSGGAPFNGEVQRYQDREGCSLADHNICVSNGSLKLVVRRQDGSACNGTYTKYTSARINSKRKREFNPWSGGAGVRVEAKIRMPAGVAGGWPAFWTLGNDIKQGPRMWNGTDDNDWPDSGEIDIAEAGWNWGGGSTSLNTLHYGTSNWSSYDGQFHAQANGGSTGIGRYEWHTFAVEWTPSNMTWYRDNQYTGSVNISSLGGQDFEHDHFVLLNMAMGGAGGGAANAADSYFPKNGATYMWEQVMEVDYVRVDKLENSGGGGGGGGGTIGNGTYEIKNVLSGKSMDVTGVNGGANTADGANIQVWSYGGGNNQKFTVTDLGGGQYNIKAVHSGKAVEVGGNSTADGANVQQWSYVGSNSQKFTIVDAGGGQYNIKAVHSGKCVEVAGNATNDGANVQQWGCVGSSSQKWTFTAR